MKMEGTQGEKWYRIDLILLRVKIFYFFELASIGALLPFMTLYMKYLGMTQSQTGILYGLMPFVGFLVRPFFGAVADKFNGHKPLLVVSCILTALFFNLLLLVPSTHKVHTSVTTNIMCSQADSYLRDCYHVNKTNSNQECPMSFHSYINKAKENVEDKTIISVVGNTSMTKNMQYFISTMPIIPDSQTDQKISCTFKCGYKSKLSHSHKVCFTNAQGTYNVDDCLSVIDFNSLPQEVELSIPNLNYILTKEVLADRVQYDDQICRDYDLKEIMYKEKKYWQVLCSDDTIFQCNLNCSHLDTCTVLVAEDLSQSSFWKFFALFLLGNIALAPIMSLGDAIAYDTLGEERRFKWGKQRVWGTFGFAFFAVISSISMEFSAASQTFKISFFLFTTLNIATALTVLLMNISKHLNEGQRPKRTLKVLCDVEIIVFFVIIFYFGALTGAIEAFLYWFLEADLGNKQKIIPGLCLLVGCSSEIVFLVFSGKLIEKFGHVQCIYFVFIAYFIRFIAYSFLENAWAVLPIELTHGVTFGVCWAAASSYASIIAPEGMSATFQGILSGLHFGFGKGAGSLITGQLYGAIGIRWTFRIYAVLSILLLLIYFILNKCVIKNDRSSKEPVELLERVPEPEVDQKLLKNPFEEKKVIEYLDEPVIGTIPNDDVTVA